MFQLCQNHRTTLGLQFTAFCATADRNGPADRSNLMMIGDVIEAINGVSIGI